MRLPIHINDPETVGAADVENEHTLKVAHFNNLETIGSANLARPRRRLAAGVWRIALESRLAMLVQRPRPRLKRNLRQFEIRGKSPWACSNDTIQVRR